MIRAVNEEKENGERETDRLSLTIEMPCVNIKALISKINQITLKSCYKKKFNQKIYIFFVVVAVFFFLSLSLVCAVSVVTESIQ